MTEPHPRKIEFEEDLFEFEAANDRELLRSALEKYRFSYETLERLTGISGDDLEAYLEGMTELEHLDQKQRADGLNLIAFLGMGINTNQVPPEERVLALIRNLNQEYGISAESIALQSGVEPSDVERFLAGRKVAAEKRFKISVGTLFLHFLIHVKS
ncbi:HTH domain-containing protein [Saccharibacillus sp. JS10]|uniref:HTH domain-containing protein n=1 Tax=Saccharibacillus sp. JS10 TaxID=2950552 RepID=UPI00210989EA|nr:HTH domain-containing protein [Saccharibacillus sp. JS10]MCQ4087370.1 hypothetical protein [Saccharibacillus sp. JS10]